ncbi:MAG TPA: thioesterase [Xanthomonadales bacterium]|nr:thioesterase [Xanthomonadales bacterium]
MTDRQSQLAGQAERSDRHDRELAQIEAVLAAMPPVRAMAVRAEAFDGSRLRLSAPLAANVNDKGCAFGGSLAGIMTLAAWGAITLRLARAGVAAEVYVADSRIRYRAPLYADLRAVGGPAEDADWPGFLARLDERGRAGIAAQARIETDDGTVIAEFEGRFAAKR